MNKITQCLLLLWLLISHSQFANSAESGEDSITVVGGVGYINKTSDFTVADKVFSPQFISLDWSVVLAYKNFYTRINFDQSIKDHTEVDGSLDNSEISTGILTLDREDMAITFGYNLFDSISVFAGFKQGETSGILGGTVREFNGDPGTLTPPPVLPVFPDFLITNTEISFKESGAFIGLSYTYLTPESGSINLSIAYADLDGETLIVDQELDSDGVVFLTPIATTGDTTGLSYSLSWTDVFSDDMNYTIGLNVIRYEYDTGEATRGTDADFSFDENFTNLSIALTKFF